MRYSTSREINMLVSQLIYEGWLYYRGSKHGRLQAPAGHPTLTVPCTPGDRRAFMNFRGDVRRALNHIGTLQARV